MIRECIIDDINKLIECVDLMQEVNDVPTSNQVDKNFLIENLKKGIVSPQHKIMIKETANKIVAFAIGSVSQNIHNNKLYGEITYMFVHPEMMNLSVSQQLFDQLEEWTKEQQCQYLIALPSIWNEDYTMNELIEQIKNFYTKNCNLVGYTFIKGLK